MLKDLLKQKNMSIYKLSKVSGIPYATLNDLVSEKSNIKNCSAGNVYKIAQALGVTMESLLETSMIQRCDFELFKSNVCHRLKRLGDKAFIAETLKTNVVQMYFDKKWYPECLYTLAMLDYISRINNIPICADYNEIRKHKLSDIAFPTSIIAVYEVTKDRNILKQAAKETIPEFARFNIIESEVRNVV